MRKRKVLFVCHNHPAIDPGGTEAYALEVYKAMKASDDFEPVFLARTGPPSSATAYTHEGTPLSSLEDPNQYLFYTDLSSYDWVNGRCRHKEPLTHSFRDFLLTIDPDIVHFQHTTHLGYDILRVTRNALPDAPIVYTLHEYLPICHHGGQMVRTFGNELCREASPLRCHQCFPDISPQEFFLRKQFIQSQLSLVDLFIAPSRFLLGRYVEWGIPRSKIRFEDHGFVPVPVQEQPSADRPRNRFAFFGRVTPFKGVDVLLKAMAILGDRFDGHLWIYGASLEVEPRDLEFQDELKSILETTKKTVTVAGEYEHAELAELMRGIDWVVVPSIWWENSPLVVQEAFMHGRPVICSNIGGMAEKVAPGTSGLHFHRNDAGDLAKVMLEAATTEGLWEQLHAGIPPVRKMADHVAALQGIYERLLTESPAAGVRRSMDLEIAEHS
jgi:glycosyltransferase involved in cell wall biosynthesis